MHTFLFLLMGCMDVEKDDSGEQQISDPISVSVRILDAMGGELPEEILLTSSLEEQTLNASATGTILVPSESQFRIDVDAAGYVTHELVAMSGKEDISLVTLLANENISLQMYGMLGLEANPEKGTLVVALDYPDLSPAVGATASIDSSHDGAFVLGAMGPSFSNVVPSSAGFVSFSNVEAGPTTISVTPPEGKNCWFYDAGGQSATVSVTAAHATVAFFMCDD